MTRMTLTSILATTALCGATGAAYAQDQDPYEASEDSWVSLTGTVVASDDDSLMLDYGENTILVEVDDWDFDDDAQSILPGEQVTVYGEIDDSFFELRSIEAGSIYVADRNTYYYASTADEEGDTWYLNPVVSIPTDGSWVSMRGTIASVNGREFVLDNGLNAITVDTIQMPYNPLDDVGVQRLDVGDRVTVTGYLDDDLFDSLEISAESILSYYDDSSN